MIHHLDSVRQGFDVEADAVVVGSGAGGAVAATNLAAAGMRTVVLEAGPQLGPAEMTRDAPRFMAHYYWDGGLRLLGGTAQVPVMQGRCLGGSTVVNSAIMYKLPDWVRDIWATEEHLDWLHDGRLDAAFERVFERTGTGPTPLTVMGRRNLTVRDALGAAGIKSGPLPRAVVGCDGCADCLVGCAGGRKQSVDRSYLPAAEAAGAEIYTCCQVQQVLVEKGRAVGVRGQVVDPISWEQLGRFTVRAPRVFMAAGAVNTPVILQDSGLHGGGWVGKGLMIHLTSGLVGFMDEIVDPWVGATQGWGAISEDVRGLKYESLWAPPSLIMVRWGDVGQPFLEQLEQVKYATVIALVYRGKCDGTVRSRGGKPKMRLHIPEPEIQVLLQGLKRVADGLLESGARHVYAGLPGTKERMRTADDTAALLAGHIRARDLSMTGNHIFCSARMSADPKRGAVDPQGRLRDVDGVYVCDASLFPSPSAVNPQATIMALSDVISRAAADCCEPGTAVV